MTFLSPSWRSLNHLKGSLNHPKKATKNCQVTCFSLLRFPFWKKPLPVNFLANCRTRWTGQVTVNGRRQFMLTFLFSYYNLELEGVLEDCFSRWWQLKHFWNFHPENWGRFPILTNIFFRWVGSTTNQFCLFCFCWCLGFEVCFFFVFFWGGVEGKVGVGGEVWCDLLRCFFVYLSSLIFMNIADMLFFFNISPKNPTVWSIVLLVLFEPSKQLWWLIIPFLSLPIKSKVFVVPLISLPSLKLTVRTWKMVVGIRLFPFGKVHFQVRFPVSFRERNLLAFQWQKLNLVGQKFGCFMGILANPPKATAPRNKGLIRFNKALLRETNG